MADFECLTKKMLEGWFRKFHVYLVEFMKIPVRALLFVIAVINNKEKEI